MASRIRIFDHFCKPLAELNGIPATPRSWVLNGYGRCDFSLGFDENVPQVNQQCREDWLQFGNLVYIEHLPSSTSNGKLPDWAGIILPPRNWGDGVCHVTAYQAEAILSFRAMPLVSVEGTPKTVFQEIIRKAHETAKNIIFQPNIIDDLPISTPDDLSLNAYDHIKKMVQRANMDWDITAEIDNKGNLQFYANLYTRKGSKVSLTLDNKNSESKSPLLSEQGTPFNQVFAYSHEQTRQARKYAVALNQAAYDDYGPLQINQIFVGNHDAGSIYTAGLNKARKEGRPRKVFGRNALDYETTFDYLSVGNTLSIKDTTVGFHPNGGFGFEAECRILSMDYNDLSNKVVLNIEVL